MNRKKLLFRSVAAVTLLLLLLPLFSFAAADERVSAVADPRSVCTSSFAKRMPAGQTSVVPSTPL